MQNCKSMATATLRVKTACQATLNWYPWLLTIYCVLEVKLSVSALFRAVLPVIQSLWSDVWFILLNRFCLETRYLHHIYILCSIQFAPLIFFTLYKKGLNFTFINLQKACYFTAVIGTDILMCTSVLLRTFSSVRWRRSVCSSRLRIFLRSAPVSSPSLTNMAWLLLAKTRCWKCSGREMWLQPAVWKETRTT